MYSRYSGISIPKNYSGSRFQPEHEPEVKTHRPSTPLSASRVAHSPSFVPIESRLKQDESEPFTSSAMPEVAITEELDEVIEDASEALAECDSCAMEGTATEGEECQESEEKEAVFLNDRHELSRIKSILSRLDKDALVILGLILLLMSDGDKENDDIIALLALLLLG